MTKWILFAVSLPFLSAQTLTLNNTSNAGLDDPTYGADFVAGDGFSLSITGAAPNAPVTLLAWANGTSITPSPGFIGNTDGNGNFTLSGTESAAFVATWQEQIFVGGVEVGQTLAFEVIPVPTSLSVVSVTDVARPNVCVEAGNFFGTQMDVRYNILSAAGTNIATTVPMIPTQSVVWYGNGRKKLGTFTDNIGGPSNEYAESSLTAGVDGTFHDVPVYACSLSAFKNAGEDQTISISIGGNSYQVRSQSFYAGSTAAYSGYMSNNKDVSISN